jgi:adenylate cyclase
MGTRSKAPAAANTDGSVNKGLKRRLAAIVFADVEGYSRLMHDDEGQTITAFKNHMDEVIEPYIGGYNGRLVKTAGDGILIEFTSAVEAVACAIEIQRGMMLRNVDVPKERRIQLRIGINLSDVVVDDAEDILGDGVNVAARLETVAEPNGICVSDEVQRIVKNKVDAELVCVGDIVFKNMPKPVKAFRVLPHDGGGAREAGIDLRTSIKTAEPMLAVLPFENASGDADQRYFADGVTNDLISNLSRFPAIGVIASHSVFAYKDRAKDIAGISREFGVRYVVEGNVQCIRDVVRINVQLIDAAIDRQLWSERYQGNLRSLFTMQEDITRKVAATVVSRVQIAESSRAMLKPPDSLEAYDFLLRGYRVYYLWTREANREAQELFRKAISADPNFARAHTAYSYSQIQVALGGWTPDPVAALEMGLKHAQIAVALSPFDFEAYEELGLACLYSRQFDRSLQCYAKALSLNPNSPDLLADYADALAHIGRTAEAAELILQAKRLNPIHPDWYDWVLGVAAFHDSRYEEALAAFLRFSDPPPVLRRDIVATYVRLGRLDEARAVVREILRDQPDYQLASENVRPYKNPELLRSLLADLRLAGLPD